MREARANISAPAEPASTKATAPAALEPTPPSAARLVLLAAAAAGSACVPFWAEAASCWRRARFLRKACSTECSARPWKVCATKAWMRASCAAFQALSSFKSRASLARCGAPACSLDSLSESLAYCLKASAYLDRKLLLHWHPSLALWIWGTELPAYRLVYHSGEAPAPVFGCGIHWFAYWSVGPAGWALPARVTNCTGSLSVALLVALLALSCSMRALFASNSTSTLSDAMRCHILGTNAPIRASWASRHCWSALSVWQSLAFCGVFANLL
mmetsp:Transcript_152132/g.369467  ORF Transcript_152132/g.369467 Transcript_152132/m.369467 type:complete len:272 (-) Transcript_152132:1225-2040(-)